MKNTIDTIKRAVFAGLAASALFCGNPAFSQATTQVVPRQYTIFSSVTLSNTQYIGSNASLPTVGLGYTNVGAYTNTFIPYSGSHHIGLVAQIVNTNKFVASSNLVITVYPAYDIGGGNSNLLNDRYGTNFTQTPVLTWTIAYTTNLAVSTNILSTQWEPATALGYCVSNAATGTAAGTASNILLTLLETVAP